MNMKNNAPLIIRTAGLRAAIASALRKGKAAPGFTLIETFVAITILVTAIVGPLSIAAKGLFAAETASDQTTAIYLAQDAIEYIRYVRDSNQLAGVDWLTNLAPCISADGSRSCFLDSSQGAGAAGNITSCSGTCPVMFYNTSTGFYNYGSPSSSNAASKFTRIISIVYPAGGNNCTGLNGCEAAVSASVNWQNGPVPHSFTVRENILKWQR